MNKRRTTWAFFCLGVFNREHVSASVSVPSKLVLYNQRRPALDDNEMHFLLYQVVNVSILLNLNIRNLNIISITEL